MDAPGAKPLLGEKQRKTIATALTLVAVLVIAGSVVGIAWLFSRFFREFSTVFLPLAVAAIAALVFAPYYDWLHDRLRLPKPLALVAVFASILLPLVAFGWFFGSLALQQLTDLVTQLPEWWRETSAKVQQRWPEIQAFLETPWVKRVREILTPREGTFVSGLQTVGGTALSVGGIIARSVGALLSWAVLPVYFAFFLLLDPVQPKEGARSFLPFLKAETRDDVTYLLSEFVSIVVTFFRGQLLIASLQGVLYAIGFSLIGLRYGFMLGLLLGLLNIIPYLGSIIGLGIGLPIALFQVGGGWKLAAGVMIVFTAVQCIEAYVLTPRIMGGRTGLHPVAIIVAVFFWGSVFDGILGLILAIPLTAFLVVFWRLVREKYIGELV